jgi:hypothetical protein
MSHCCRQSAARAAAPAAVHYPSAIWLPQQVTTAKVAHRRLPDNAGRTLRHLRPSVTKIGWRSCWRVGWWQSCWRAGAVRPSPRYECHRCPQSPSAGRAPGSLEPSPRLKRSQLRPCAGHRFSRSPAAAHVAALAPAAAAHR